MAKKPPECPCFAYAAQFYETAVSRNLIYAKKILGATGIGRAWRHYDADYLRPSYGESRIK